MSVEHTPVEDPNGSGMPFALAGVLGREFAGDLEELIEEVEQPGVVVAVAPRTSNESANDAAASSSSSLRGSGRGAKRMRRALLLPAATLFELPSELEVMSSEEAVDAELDAA